MTFVGQKEASSTRPDGAIPWWKIRKARAVARKWRYIMDGEKKKKKKIRNGNEDGFSPSISETVRRIHDVRCLLRQVFFTASRLAVCDSFLCPLRKLLLLRVRNLLTLRFSLSIVCYSLEEIWNNSRQNIKNTVILTSKYYVNIIVSKIDEIIFWKFEWWKFERSKTRYKLQYNVQFFKFWFVRSRFI